MYSDTTPESARLRIQVLRDIGGAERLRQALALSDSVRRLAEQGRKDRARPDQLSPTTDAA